MQAKAIYSKQVLVPNSDGTPSHFTENAILIKNGKIAALCSKSEIPYDTDILDYSDYTIIPGIVDTHAHINEPGRTEWEGFETATRAAAVGGITTVVDMPLNSIPPTTTLANLRQKEAAARNACSIDYGFWGGVIPGNCDELEPMIEAGVRGFKCFLCPSGVEEFPQVGVEDLKKAMRILAKHRVPLLVHAELEDHGQEKAEYGNSCYSSYLHSRPRQWEDRAVHQMIELCETTGCPVHVVHLSSADAIEEIHSARGRGLPITVETCPHYLTFVAEEIPDGATFFKCAPPIRERENRERLWDALAQGKIDMIVSDHSPCTPELKELERGDFKKAWGGISSLQWSLSAIWTQAQKRGMNLLEVSKWMSYAPARLAGILERKGSFLPGRDADLIVFDAGAEFRVEASQIQHRHKLTPYSGLALKGKVLATFLRGNKIAEQDGLRNPPLSRGGEQTYEVDTSLPGRISRLQSGVLQNGQTLESKLGRNLAQERRITAIVSRPPSHHSQSASSLQTITIAAPSLEAVPTLRVAFTELVDLASEELGGRVLEANDEFFAPKENLIKPGRGVFIPGKYTDNGKWMDGWETRRRRSPGSDWCVIQLAAPGVICGLDVDTNHFLGNFPEYCSVEAASTSNGPWTTILPKAKLQGGVRNLFPVSSTQRWTHLRLNIFPDGGVARLRVYGSVSPDFERMRAQDRSRNEVVDLASVLNGAKVVACNDMFFGNKNNLIHPGRAKNMGEGWETRRKRVPLPASMPNSIVNPPFDWIVVELGAPGRIKKVEVDTHFFKGNFPESCSLEGCSIPKDRRAGLVSEDFTGTAIDALNGSFEDFDWKRILSRTKLLGDTVHIFENEMECHESVTHVKLKIYPDGGVSRLRVFGTLSEESGA